MTAETPREPMPERIWARGPHDGLVAIPEPWESGTEYVLASKLAQAEAALAEQRERAERWKALAVRMADVELAPGHAANAVRADILEALAAESAATERKHESATVWPCLNRTGPHNERDCPDATERKT